MRTIDYKAMLFGFMYGDGWLSKSSRNTYNSGFSGDIESLEVVKKDLINIYGDIGLATITSKETMSEKYNIKGTTNCFVVNKNVIDDFIKLGMPVGKKVECDFKLPQWITCGDYDIKRYFISGIYAAEGYTPTMQKNDYTPKSIGFNIQKRIEHESSFKYFISQLSDILASLSIEHSIEYTYIKSSFDNIKCAIIFHNNLENTIRIFNTLYIRYNIPKLNEFNIMKKYLLYKQECLANLQMAYNMSLIEPRISRKVICDTYNVTNHQIDHWRNRKSGIRIPNNFPKYTQFKTNILSI